jgi:glycosyltransferase involved in cell wall biosynthesis
VAILLACYNGAVHLRAQLDSYMTQSLPPALLLVGDDGSTDASRALITEFAIHHPALPLHLLEGPRQGAAQNFLQLLRAVPEAIDLVAISDQDDIWLPQKLARGAELLAGVGPARPGLVLGTTLVCSEDLSAPQRSPLPKRPPDFRHALVQNIAGGNTMMLNRAALDLLAAASLEAGCAAGAVVVHDWWIYQMISGAGGAVIFDAEPGLLYRQHAGNLIGANSGVRAKILRLRMMMTGRLQQWNAANLRALGASSARLTPQNRQVLRDFAQMRQAGPLKRLWLLHKSGLYRQGLAGRISLWVAAALGKI